MRLPEFSAERSLVKSHQHRILRPRAQKQAGRVLPQGVICTIDEDATAASGKTEFACQLIEDGIVIPVPAPRKLF
jgi:hypothetical protein